MPKGGDGFFESLNVGIRATCRDKRAQPSPVADGVGCDVGMRGNEFLCRALSSQQTTEFTAQYRLQ